MDEQNKTLPQAPAGSPPGQPGTEVKPATSLASTEPAAEASSPNQAPQTVTPSTDTTVITPTSNAATPAVDSGAASAEASTTPAPASAPQEAAASTAAPATPPADPAPVAASAEPIVSPPSEEGVVPAPVNDVPTIPASSGNAAASDGVPAAPTAHDSAKSHSGHKMHAPHMKLPSRKGIGLMLIVLVLLASLGSSVYFAIGQRNAKKEVADLKSRVAVLDSDVHDLPEGAVKLSECVPNMGFHYLEQGADPKFGPFLLVSTKGKVIGSEYMFNNSMLTKIPDAQIPLEVLLTNGPVLLHDWQYNSIDFSRATAGHPGFEDDHYDVHLYTVNPEEQKRACE